MKCYGEAANKSCISSKYRALTNSLFSIVSHLGIGALTLFEQYLSFFEQILSLPTQNEGLLIDDF